MSVREVTATGEDPSLAISRHGVTFGAMSTREESDYRAAFSSCKGHSNTGRGELLRPTRDTVRSSPIDSAEQRPVPRVVEMCQIHVRDPTLISADGERICKGILRRMRHCLAILSLHKGRCADVLTTAMGVVSPKPSSGNTAVLWPRSTIVERAPAPLMQREGPRRVLARSHSRCRRS
jgi:hypothetical protein